MKPSGAPAFFHAPHRVMFLAGALLLLPLGRYRRFDRQ